MNKQQIHARLIERGSNFRQFSLQHGYDPRLVTHTVDRWAGRATMPRGRRTYQIIKDLSLAIDAEIIPGILRNNPSISD